jgi:hypothetical protein
VYDGVGGRFESIGADAKLLSESWRRLVGGSGLRQEITFEDVRLVEEGFV